MTSLAKQLQRLAVPHIQAVLGEDKKKASLLFDHKEAASIDRETFHALGLNGLEELETLDSEFQEFELTLYGDSSLTFERSVQTKDVNEKLDATISKFLVRLSPYCLLKPAHKALEWLIHRFHIHFYNVDHLMMCFLPYHESKIFVRILQIIKLDSKTVSKWDWLQPLQKSGVHLSRKTLVNHCMTNLGFLSYVCDMVPHAVKVLSEKSAIPKCRVLFSFYATTVIGVLDAGNMKEELLSTLLPHLSRGMKSNVVEYKAASYMILAQLLHKANLKPAIVKTLQHILAKSICQNLMGEAMACMLLMFQTQDMSYTAITKKTFKYLSRHYSIVDTVGQLSAQFDASLFLSCFLDRLIPAAFKHAVGMATSGESSESESPGRVQEYMSMLHRLLSNIKLQDDTAEGAALKFLEVYIKHGNKYLDDDVDDRIKDSLQGIVRQLEGKYSTAVDKAIARILNQCKKKHDHDLVQEFLNLYVLSVPRQLVTDSETSLVLSLNHRLPTVREKAVSTLIQNRQGLEDESFLKDSLSLRLKDEDPTVVTAALKLGEDLWTVFNDDKMTINLLQKPVLAGINKEKWREAATLATGILGAYNGDLDQILLTTFLPCFFLKKLSEFNIELVSTLLSSPLATRNMMLKAIANEWKNSKKSASMSDLGEINVCLARSVATGLLKTLSDHNIDIVRSWSRLAADCSDFRVPCLMLLVLDNLVAMVTDRKTKLELCGCQVQLIETVQGRKDLDLSCEEEQLSVDWKGLLNQKDKKLNKGRIPVMLCLKSLKNVVGLVQVPVKLASERVFWQLQCDESLEDVFLCLCVRLYNMLLDKAMMSGPTVSIHRTLLKLMEKTCFSNSELYLKFLGMLWTQHANDLADDLHMTLTLQARSLKLGLAYISTLDTDLLSVLFQTQSFFTNLLIILTSAHVPIRNLGLQLFKELLSKAPDQESIYISLLKKVVHCDGEITSDATYICQVVASVFKSVAKEGFLDSDMLSPRKTRKSRKSVGKTASKDKKQVCLLSFVQVIVDKSTPCYVQYGLLEILAQLNTKDVLNSFIPLMERLLSQDQNSISKMEVQCLNLLVRRFTLDTKDCLAPSSKGLDLFMKTLRRHQIGQDISDSPQSIAIDQLTKDLYSSLEEASQHKLLSTLFDVCVEIEELFTANQVRKVLKHMSVNGAHICDEMKQCLKLPTATTVREAKRQKKAAGDSVRDDQTDFDSKVWQRVAIILEAVQSKKKIHNFTVLVPVCFQILSSILESENHVSAEYMKQLILTLLYNICGRMEKLTDRDEDSMVPEKQFNMELIVNCIRSSDNPQTHHQALLLLTSAARIYPEHLLHNMMSVFTFMGANIMRQDDAYSFLIISKILETVVPALIMACKQRRHVPKGITNELEDIITMVIQVFVDSYPYIPEHRRHLLFNKLLTVIGEEQYLWRTLMLMMDMVVTKGSLKAELAAESQETGSLPPGDIEFCLTLCSGFSSAVQLSSAREMIRYLIKLPDDKEDDTVKHTKPTPQSFGKLHKDDVSIFSVTLHTAKQLRHFKYATVHLLISQFSSTDFIAQMAENSNNEVLQHFQNMLEIVLQFVSRVTMVTNKSSDKSTAKFWKALQHKVHDLLDKLVSLLPDSLFIEVIGGLVSHDLPTIQRKAMDLLNTKLQQQKEISEGEASALLPLVGQLRVLICDLSLGHEVTEEGSVNSQTAFISLKLLCRHIGYQNAHTFVNVLKAAVDVFNSKQTSAQVASCALLCIAEICNTLKVHVIQHLPTFMPSLLKVMKDQDNLLQNELYLMSVVTAVNKVIENLSNFLSPYLLDILTNVCMLSSQSADVLQKPAVQLRLKTIRTTLSTTLPTRVLLPAVTECYSNLLENSMVSISSLMSLFGDHIGHIGREDLTSHLTQLQSFFLQCLDLRVDHPELSEKKITKLENVTIETIITMVMKLSEATFKPFLFKVFDWATSNDEFRDRVLVFYILADRLAERLRSLFTLFAGHIVNHAAKMLQTNNKMKKGKKFFPTDKAKRKKSCLLLDHLLDCLQKCCLYDTEGFITKERFDMLMQPIVDQIDNDQGGDGRYETRVREHLVPCLVQLAVAAQDDSLWRALNYQVCLKTRSEQSQIKEGALHTIDVLHKKLGEDYMPLLPDTIPFLAELMEDDSEEVEKKCQTVIREMENTLGEPLQKYF